MSICRLLRRPIATVTATAAGQPLIRALHNLTLSPCLTDSISSSPLLPPSRSYAFSTAEEAAAERRRRKRRLRIEPPLNALQRNHNPPPRDPNAPRLPETTNSLVGPRLNLHNRVQSLIRAFDLDNAAKLARNAVFTRTRPTVFTCNAIIAAMYRAKRYNDAIDLFKYFYEQHDIVPNIVSYNNLIVAHCDDGRVDTALEVYRHIIATAPFSPSAVTYRHLTKGLIDVGRIEEAVDLLREMLNKGHGSDSLVYNNVIKAFLEVGDLEKANEFFTELTGKCPWYDGTVNATFMDWWFKQGKDKEGMENYRSFLDKKLNIPPTTGNALLEVLVRHGKKEAAETLFEFLLDSHTPPSRAGVTSETFNIMVNQCFKEQNFELAVRKFRQAGTNVKSRPFQMDVAGFNNIITRFCEHEMLSEAEQYFKELMSKSLSPDVTSYRTLIDAYLKAGRIDDALQSLSKMVRENLWVVASYATVVFSELIKNGKAVDCGLILSEMGNRDPKPDPSVYDVVIRGLCDASAFDTCKYIVEQMMKYGVVVPPELKEFVREAFAKIGQSEIIEDLLDESRWKNNNSGHPRGQGQRQPWRAGEQPLGSSSLPGQAPFVQPQSFDSQQQMGTQMPSAVPHWSGQQSSHDTQNGAQQPLHYPQNGGHHQLHYPQNGGHQPLHYPESGGHQPLHYSRMGGQQPAQYSQMRGQQQWQPSQYSQTAPQQQPSWYSQEAGQQPPQYSQVARQQATQYSQFEGQQPPQYSQMAGEQPPQYSHFGGQQPPQYSEIAGQQSPWSSQMGAQQFSETNQMARHQPYESQQKFHSEVEQRPNKPTEVVGHNSSESLEWRDSRKQAAV